MTMSLLSPSKRLDKCTYVLKQQVLLLKSDRNDDSGCNVTSERSSGPSVFKGKQTEKITSSAAVKPDVPVSKFTSFDSCLENRTKEERLMLDVEMYKHNERAFVHDVTRFMMRNGLKPCKGPFWQNQSIGLFQLFLAVHERGGYEQVTCKKKWAAVYREVTETPCQKDVSNSCGARLFYYRHLYPYELYVHGKDFAEVISELKTDVTCQSSKKKASNIKQRKKKKNPVQKQNPCKIGERGMEAEDDIASDSLREMLQTLEEHSKLALEDGLMENEIDITFYDDSTPSRRKLLPLANFEPQATTTVPMAASKGQSISESGVSSRSPQVLHPLENVSQALSQQNKWCESNQVVPSPMDNTDGNGSTQKKRNSSSASAFSQQLLEELSVLQDAINFIDHQMD